jgi:hypothetical protein
MDAEIAGGGFLEYAEVHGNLYDTSRRSWLRWRSALVLMPEHNPRATHRPVRRGFFTHHATGPPDRQGPPISSPARATVLQDAVLVWHDCFSFVGLGDMAWFQICSATRSTQWQSFLSRCTAQKLMGFTLGQHQICSATRSPPWKSFLSTCKKQATCV